MNDIFLIKKRGRVYGRIKTTYLIVRRVIDAEKFKNSCTNKTNKQIWTSHLFSKLVEQNLFVLN